MSTIGYESWAVDLAEVGAIYPFQGAEVLMVLVGIAIWIGWHIVQIKQENREIEEDLQNAREEEILRDIDRY